MKLKYIIKTVKMNKNQQSNRLVHVRNLIFQYDEAPTPVLCGVDFDIHVGERIVLVGANGAGKSTLLRVLSGTHLSRTWDAFDVLGNTHPSDQFNGLAYLGGVWRRKLTNFSGMSAFRMDVRAGDMMQKWQEENRVRRDILVGVLGINLDWRMHRVSDGQRKKVRIMLKLLRPWKLCIVDEFAVELDILARKRLMDHLASECRVRGAAVVYATHIFDQMDEWATHIAFVRSDSTVSTVEALANVSEYQALCRGATRVHCPMYRFVLSRLSVGSYMQTESEKTPARKYKPYDSGYESGRSKEMQKEHNYGPGLSDAEARRRWREQNN